MKGISTPASKKDSDAQNLSTAPQNSGGQATPDTAFDTTGQSAKRPAGFHRQPEHYVGQFTHVILPKELFPKDCSLVVNRVDYACGEIVAQVIEERERQDGKWGGPGPDSKITADEWHDLLSDYVGWARRMAKMNSPEKARRRLIQVAALAIAQVEAIDAKARGGSNG